MAQVIRPRRGRLAGPAGGRQRERLVAAMVVLSAERGWQNVGVDTVCVRSGVSKRTYYELFADREDGFVAAVEQVARGIRREVLAAVAAAGPAWADRVGAALVALLHTLDADRRCAWVAVVEAMSGSERARAARGEALQPLVDLVDEKAGATPLAGAAAAGAVIELAYRHLTGPDAGAPMSALIAPAAFVVLAPHLSRRAALRRAGALAAAPTPTAPHDEPIAVEPDLRMTELTEASIGFLAEHPGACNVEIAAGVGVEHDSQISRHLARLERGGAARRTRDGRANAWELTELGQRLAAQVRRTGSGGDATTRSTPTTRSTR